MPIPFNFPQFDFVLFETRTPQRSIENFCDGATPVDSPESDEIFEPPKKLVPHNEEVITPVGSSQSSQRVKKRELNDEVLSQGNVSKKTSVDEMLTHSFQDDSVFDNSEILSNLGSPSRPIPFQRNKRSISLSAFSKAIASGLDESDLESSGMENLESPVSSQNRLIFISKSRVSPTTFNKVLQNQQEQDSEPILSSLESPISPIQLNPFDSESDDGQYSDSDVYDQRFEDDDRGDILNMTYDPAQPSNVIVLGNVEESSEIMLNEDSVCEMLEKVIQEHVHQTSGLPSESPPPKPVRTSNAVELYNDETSEKIQEESIEGEPTVNFFNDQTFEISPVEKVEGEMVRVAPHHTSGRVDETPTNSSPKEIRRNRLFSLFSTPTSETDTEPKSVGVVDLDWPDKSKEDISQGFGGSEHLSDGMTAASNSDHAKTMDSAVYVTGEDNQAPEFCRSYSSNTPHDHHRTPRDSSTSEDRLRVYQEKSREGLIGLLEDRNNEIFDLKDYIDSLLLKVIDTCPTVLQTAVKAKTCRK